jgi:CheY-like chemotaxis protein
MAMLPILLVDDDRDNCDVLAKGLSIFGYQVDVAYDGLTALEFVSQKEYGLTISDYHPILFISSLQANGEHRVIPDVSWE